MILGGGVCGVRGLPRIANENVSDELGNVEIAAG